MKRTDGIGWHKQPDELRNHILPGVEGEESTASEMNGTVAPNEAE